MELVDPEVTRRKVDREIELWSENAKIYRRRGWILLGREGPVVDVAFTAALPLGGRTLPIIGAAVRIDYQNYDLWAPSVEFIDPSTGEFAPPLVGAVMQTPEGPRNLLVGSHPQTGRPFFCVPGIRQYHDHPQHSGDSWLLHRSQGAGSLATICDRIWRTMPRTVVGMQVAVTTLPPESGQAINVEMQILAGDIDAMRQGSGAAPAEGQVA